MLNADTIKIPAELSNEEVIGVCCAFRTAVASFERLGALGIQSTVVIQGCGPNGCMQHCLPPKVKLRKPSSSALRT